MDKSKSMQFREEAIPLVSLDPKTNKFIINDEAIDFLNSLKGDIGIVSVAGMYRTGKSYLLNRMLLDRSTGFGVGPTINPCTKGLWIWGSPIKGQTLDGDPLDIIIIDSEGIGALDEDSSHDSRIFALAILLSSCFLYNSVGSIDESAIQNLSLVVNLTKNIHIKSSLGGDEPDSEDYAHYFPNFIWVVRDFTLQLVDSEGDPISTKEYLEKALAPQKGFSDGVEQKNRIRRLLTSFFRERDCFTLVRPLTNEENLQNLEFMDLDQLRPEFHQQMLSLRRHITNRIKPKQMDGKVLNGQMYAGLIKAYIDSINNGSVPNIESAWSYVCKSECMKAVSEGIESYDSIVKEVLHNKLPLPAEELKNYHMIGKEKACTLFKKKAVGEFQDEFMKELRKKIKTKFGNIKLENEKESNRASSAFIIREFGGIERKLKNNEYKTFQDFERELKLFHSYFLENGPNGPNKRLIIYEFLQKSINDGAQFFVKNLQQELELQKTIFEDVQKKLELEINELRNDNSKEKQYLLSKISQLECERSELEIKEKNIKEALEQIKEDRNQLETDLRNEWQSEREHNQNQLNEMQAKLLQNEEALKEMETKIYLNNSEHEKEKALLSQKVEYYEKTLEEQNKKEKELNTELKNSKKDHASQIKEQVSKYETQNRSLQQKVDQLQERVVELENDLSSKTQQFEYEKINWQSNDHSSNQTLEDAQNMIKNLQKEIAEARESNQSKQSLLKEENEKLVEELREKNALLEKSGKQKEEMFKNQKHTLEKEKAILNQKIEFLEVQLNEAKNQHTEIKKAYDATLKCFEGSSEASNQNDSKQMQELKDIHRSEIRKLEAEFESIRKRLQQQVENLTEKNNELELKSKVESSDLEKEISNLKEELATAEEIRNQLTDQNKVLEQQKTRLLKDSEERYAYRIKNLESQIEEQNSRTEREIKDIQIKSEENLQQLKNFYEIEKERLERRILEEKDKYEKKLANVSEEYETKLKEDKETIEEELENAKEDLHEAQLENTAIAQQYEHELHLRQQTIETLEKYVQEAKENLSNIHSSNATALEQHLSNFSTERNQMISKIENLTLDMAKKDKEIFALTQAKEQLEVNAMKKEIMLEKAKKELTDEKNSLTEKLEDTKTKLQKVNDEYLEKKVEYGRELALSQQQNEFLNKKIEELQRQVDEIIKRYEEKLKIQKQEYTQEMNEKIEKINQEKALVETKYDKSKKSLKEIESTYNKQLSQLEKEKSIIHEKLINMEGKRAENDQKLIQDNQNYLNQIYELKENHGNEKKTLLAELEKYKAQFLQLEQDHCDVVSNYERDKALWKGKFHFLEQQKEQAKNDLVDAQRKFELTLNHLQKHRNADKEDHENNQNAMVQQLEKKHELRVKEVQDQYEEKIQEYQLKIKKLEKELKNANDKLTLDSHGKMGSQSFIERKITEMSENEKRLQAEVEALKNERDAKVLEYQRLFDQERDQLKGKIQDAEQKYREAESRRNGLVFEHEKEKAKWNLERDHLANQKNELTEMITKLEKKKETLLRENEKLKNETKVSRRSINLAPGLVSNNLYGGKNSTKIRTTSPAHSKGSSISLDKNLSDITNFPKPTFDTQTSFTKTTNSTSVTSEDEA